jgi:SulP family sulfate permease
MPYRVTLLVVFFLTVVFDLTVAVEVGLVAACLTFIYRISSLSRCEEVAVADFPELEGVAGPERTLASYRLYGALFFGAVKLIENLQDNLPGKVLLLDLKNLLYVDASGADTLNDLARSCHNSGVRLLICGLSHQPLDIARRSGFVNQVGAEQFYPDLAAGVSAAVKLAAKIAERGPTS